MVQKTIKPTEKKPTMVLGEMAFYIGATKYVIKAPKPIPIDELKRNIKKLPHPTFVRTDVEVRNTYYNFMSAMMRNHGMKIYEAKGEKLVEVNKPSAEVVAQAGAVFSREAKNKMPLAMILPKKMKRA